VRPRIHVLFSHYKLCVLESTNYFTLLAQVFPLKNVANNRYLLVLL
jgi:hypothetical protein